MASSCAVPRFNLRPGGFSRYILCWRATASTGLCRPGIHMVFMYAFLSARNLPGGGGDFARGCLAFHWFNEDRYEVFQRILVVCVGNICRSPTAEILFRHHLPNIQVSSAGLNALVGHTMDATAQALLEEHHMDGSRHVARQLDDDMIRDAELILGMERAHIDTIVRRTPHAMGRALLLGQWIGQREITDPYQQQRPAFEHVYQLIDSAVLAWAPYLRPSR